MKKLLIALLLIVPTTLLASPTSVDRITNRIEPLIKTDYIKGSYFVASSTTATSTFAGKIKVTNTGTQPQIIGWDEDTGIHFDGPDIMSFHTGSVQRLLINALGNVGIGTSSPYARLSVEGSSALGNSALAGYFIATSTTATSTFAGPVGVGTSTPNSLFGVYEYIDFRTDDTDTFVGYQAGKNVLKTGISNTFFGYQAGMGSSTAPSTSMDLNTGLGYQVLMKNTTGSANTAIGYQALFENSTGFNNVAIGRGTLDANTTGAGNTGLGINALASNVDGAENFGLGQSALQNNVSGDANVCIGRTACLAVLGDNNIGIGRSALTSNTGSGSIAIGYYAGAYETANNAFYVGNTDFGFSTAEKAGSLMYGTMTGSNTSNLLQINARTGISTTSSFARFSIKGIGTGTGVNFHTTNSSNVPLVTGLDNGNFGIGTTSPYAKLSVVGEVVARNFTATTTTATSTISGPLKLGSAGSSQTVGNATLVAGTVTVTTGAATSGGFVHLTRKTSGGTIGTAITYTITNGSFTITSDNILDTSTFTYLITQ